MSELEVKTFKRFTEVNEWHDEIWHFMIRVAGNELALKKLEAMLVSLEGPDHGQVTFKLHDGVVDETTVDALVTKTHTTGHDCCRYKPPYTKLDGHLSFPDFSSPLEIEHSLVEGRIKHYVNCR